MADLRFFGVLVRVSGPAALQTTVEELWHAFLVPTDHDAEPALVIDDATSIADLAVRLNGVALAAWPGLAIHAGVIDTPSGVMAFPGTSGSGKSTLTGACMRGGFDYVSDEALCLSYGLGGAGGENVTPYPRPLGLSPWSMRALGMPPPATGAGLELDAEHVVAPTTLGRVADRPGPLRYVVVPQRCAAPRPELHPVHKADAVALMLRLSFNHYREPRAAFHRVVDAVRDAKVWALHYQDPAQAAGFLADRFG
jgi:hypothetical protein